jgi:hypothetical protein
MPHRALAMIQVADSPDVFCVVKGGNKIQTPIPISSFRRRFGKRFAISLVSLTGKLRMDMPSHHRGLKN